MGLFDLMASEPKPPEVRDPRDEFWFQRLGSGSEHGVPVTVERARLVPVVKDCVDTLAQSVSSLQFGVFERLNNGQAKRHDRHPHRAADAKPK